jgi:hypothetical protein
MELIVPGESDERLQAVCGCGKSLEDIPSLVKHIVHSHNPRKPTDFTCCVLSLSSFKPAWLDHLKEKHSCGPNPLPCTTQECAYKFPKLDPLRKHIKSHHTSEARCDCHGTTFKTMHHLTQHLRLGEKTRLKRELEMASDEIMVKKNCHTSETQSADFPGIPFDPNQNLRSVRAQETIRPFLHLIQKWPLASQTVSNALQTDTLDGTTPIHWFDVTAVHSRNEILAQVFHDTFEAPPLTFPSGYMVDSRPEDSISGIAKVLSYLNNPDPNCPTLMYATNIRGTSLPFLLPRLLPIVRHFDEIETRSYASNITPEGTLVDLHKGESFEAELGSR